jgi:hypothetical protein
MTDLLLRQVAESRPGCEEGSPDDYDVIGPGGLIIGRIFKAITSPPGTPWMWTLAYGQDEDRSSTHGYEATRDAARKPSPGAGKRRRKDPSHKGARSAGFRR